MESVQSRGLQCFRRVEAWFADHPTVITAAGSSAAALGNQVTALQQVVDRMTAQAAEEITAASQTSLAAKDEPTLRTELRMLHMRAIVKVAGALRGKVPGTGVFKTPSRDMSSESLIVAAEAMHTMATPYEGVFVEHGLPADFLAQLDAAAAALKSSVDARGVAQTRRTGAGTSLENDLTLGKQILVIISASLSHVLKSDPVTLASWRQARRITVKGARPKAVPVSAPPASGSASVASGGGSAAAVASKASPAGTSPSNIGVRRSDTGVQPSNIGVRAVGEAVLPTHAGASADPSSNGPVPSSVAAVPGSDTKAA